ncbi:ATPase inhibitor subunit zeta [Rhizobium mesoamericanum]|uniref:ATPase inhibitor subunit zeta n=1 Tax=Rhizobium mesoamericanum TaxID=1079800 RepID=UPI0004029C41|nr:ATPase inhibitor subunit zeta [Rhizobium mesoamericanum]
MTSVSTDVMRLVRRNKLVGMWAAKKLGLVGDNAKAYSDELAKGALNVERNDILAIIRRDFDAAGVVQADEDILAVMNLYWLEAGKKTKGSDASDAALVHIARNLMR